MFMKKKSIKLFIYTCLIALLSVTGYGQTYKIVGTGQTISYNNSGIITAPASGQSFYGQNANHQGNAPSYTNNGDGTITDNVSGLMWEKTTDRTGDGTINYYDKKYYSDALSGASSCRTGGYSDWRLPTVKELYSLIMYYGAEPSPTATSQGSAVPFINTTYFTFGYGDLNSGSHGASSNERLIDAQYATSTLYVSTTMGGTSTMFGVNFADGRIKGYPSASTKKYYVLYVRGNTAYGTNTLTNNGNGTITDNATNLMWMQNDNGTPVMWESALSYAENFSYGGYTDWRLPDAKELQSIVDYSRSPSTTNSAAINSLFNCTQITNEAGVSDYGFYWSNTTFCSLTTTDGSDACYLSFGRAMGYMSSYGGWIDVHGAGAQRSDPKTGNPSDYPTGFGPQGDAIRIYNYVRLVRSVTTSSVSVTGVSLNATTASLTTGATSQLTATIAPTNATNKAVTWSSSNTAVATVSSSGLVTAVATGTATITVKTTDGNKTASCVVTVTASTDPLLLSYFLIANKYTADYMRPTNGSSTSVITQYESATVPTMSSFLWEFRAAPTLGYYYILNKWTGLAIQPTGASTANNAGISQVALTTSNQNYDELQWKLQVSDEAGYYWIQNKKSGLVIRPSGGANGTGIAIVQNTLVTAYSSFKWSFVGQSLKSAHIGYEEVEESNKELSIFPNPVKNELRLQNVDENATIEVYNLTGKLILVRKPGTDENTIDVSNLKAGIYLLKATTTRKTSLIKFMKK
jgi:hypothetical protein